MPEPRTDGVPRSALPINDKKTPPSRPSNPYDTLLSTMGTNIAKFTQDDFGTIAHFIPDLLTHTSVQESQFIVMSYVRQHIFDDSINPAQIFAANMRNRDSVGKPPLRSKSYTHGMPIQYMDHLRLGILASEFFGEKTAGNLPFRLYLSQITTPPERLVKMTPLQILENTYHKGLYGLGEGKATLLINPEATFKNRMPNAPIAGTTENFIPWAIPIGIVSTDITGCVVTESKDFQRVIGVFKGFPFYVPVYDGAGNLLFKHEDWLKVPSK